MDPLELPVLEVNGLGQSTSVLVSDYASNPVFYATSNTAPQYTGRCCHVFGDLQVDGSIYSLTETYNTVGPTGATGAQGVAGAASTITGPTGAQGVVGAASTVTGPTGAQGAVGSDSTVTGPTGAGGAVGADSVVTGRV